MKNIDQAKAIAKDIDKILKEFGLEWLRRKFNKYWISYKNGRLNVMEIYFETDGTPGIGFHVPEPPTKLSNMLPASVTEKGEWSDDYKVYYVPVIQLGISMNDLRPLFEESKKFRC